MNRGRVSRCLSVHVTDVSVQICICTDVYLAVQALPVISPEALKFKVILKSPCCDDVSVSVHG